MKRYGLFVGVDKYRNGISSLSCACNDAKELSLYFSRHFDKVNFLLDENAHCEDVLDQVEEMTQQLSAGDLFVFYFAGHGREFQGEHYLVGPSGRANTAFYRRGTVTVPELFAASDKVGLNRLFILDCCRTDLIAGRGEAFVCSDSRDPAMNAAIKNVADQGGLPPLIINSCATGQQAFELKEKKHGVFTQALLEVLTSKTHPVADFASLLAFLDEKISQLIPVGRTQTVSPNGNTNLWNTIPLFANWEKKSESPESTKTIQTVSSEKAQPSAPSPEQASVTKEEKLTPAEIREYLQLTAKIKQFMTVDPEPDDKDYVEQQLQSADRKYKAKRFKEAYQQLSSLNQWCNEKQPKYELLKLEKTLAAQADTIRESLPHDFASRMELAHHYWLNDLFEEAKEEFSTLRVIISRFEEKRIAEEWKNAIVQGLVFNEEKTILTGCSDKTIQNAVIPSGVRTIAWRALDGCSSLTKVTIPDSVTTIGWGAFDGCTSLTEVTIPDSVTKIGVGAFYGCPCEDELKKKHPELF